MRIARVTGQLVSTVKQDGLNGLKLLMVRDVDPHDPTADLAAKGAARKGDYVAIDLVGVGEGEVVVVAHGSAARVAASAGQVPTDAAIVAIVDSIASQGSATYVRD